jgi:hypothetical protein
MALPDGSRTRAQAQICPLCRAAQLQELQIADRPVLYCPVCRRDIPPPTPSKYYAVAALNDDPEEPDDDASR